MKDSEYILILLIIILIAVMFYGIYLIKQEGFKCLSSPLTFGAEKIEKYYGQMYCYCSNGISFNKTTIMRTSNPNFPTG